MPSPARQSNWDIFCNVIDNYGDIGVCWRLARQLAAEHGFEIRLWVDELAAFQRICPEIDPQLLVQKASGIEVRRWDEGFPEVVPGSVVIEAFACHLPENFISAMARCHSSPVWINLDYLSAEDWIKGCHALPSPHPRLPLTKYFFFPGFNEATGGLLREHDLEERRLAYGASLGQQADFWQTLGLRPPSPDALIVSLFAYKNPSIADLFDIWAHGKQSVCCLAPVTPALSAIEAFVGHPIQAGDIIHRGRLEIRVLPFVAQSDYDRLLWSCDINFVRGEDSFMRAQWAAKPMVWQIYPQDDEAHLPKLDAFLNIYCSGLPETSARAVRRLFLAWNAGADANRITPDLWAQWMASFAEIRKHAANWANNLSKQEDLCSCLVRFCRSKL
jgi:uncharacterized repeat protein (TIGR03837 family)